MSWQLAEQASKQTRTSDSYLVHQICSRATLHLSRPMGCEPLHFKGGLMADQCYLLAIPQLHPPEARHDTRMIVRQGRSETG